MDRPLVKALQVCANCKARKRKCDKELPTCGACNKLLLKCQYDFVPVGTFSPVAVTTAPPMTGYTMPTSEPYGARGFGSADTYASSPSGSGSGTPWREGQVHGGVLRDWYTSATFFSAFTLRPTPAYTSLVGVPSNVAAEITREVFEILTSHGESLPSMVSTYFRTIGNWFPIISPENLQRRLTTIQSESSAEFAALILTMFLSIQPPREGENGTMQTPIYFTAKALLSALLGSGRTGIEVVQASTLMTLYEHGHGMLEVAHLSMAVCAKLARKLISSVKSTENAQDTEEGRLWWGVVILERLINLHLSVPEIHLTTSHQLLPIPTDMEMWYQTPNSEMRTQSGRTAGPVSATLQPFGRTAQASVGLSQVLQLVSKAGLAGRFKGDDVETLDESLQALAAALHQQTSNSWDECCAAIALCTSAIITLHTAVLSSARPPASPNSSAIQHKSLLALQSAANFVRIKSERLLLDFAFIDLLALPVSCTFTIYQGALTHIRFAGEEFGSAAWKGTLDTLKMAVALFGRRWAVGKSYPQLLDEALDEEVTRRTMMYKDYSIQQQ